jgi:hypothetical protein
MSHAKVKITHAAAAQIVTLIASPSAHGHGEE